MNGTSRALALGIFILASGQALGQDAVVLREAVGARASELGEMELTPFDTSLWATLESWTNGPALDPGATDGKVVLIATLASWNPASTRMIPTIQALKTKYEGQGLLVVGVHHPQGWDSAAEKLSQRKADFLIAHDASGKFREGIKADQDPDFYLIDRAGQLRFADIRNESLEGAVTLLLGEDTTAAGSLRDRLAEEARQREAEFGKPKTIQEQINLRALPEVPFTPPSAQAYELADWPKQKRDPNSGGRDEDRGPRARPLPASGWFGETPPKVEGRAVAYYAWELEDPRGTQIVREMDQLQRRFGRDAVIVGVLTGIRSQDRSGGRDNENINPQELATRLGRMCRNLGIEHPMLIDIGGQLFSESGSRGNNQDYGAAVVSSDSVVRWEGSVGDHGFRAALDRVIAVDPGVQARRAAESAYIKARGG